MSENDIKARLRSEAAAEALQADEQEEKNILTLRKWKRRTTWLGILLVLSIVAAVPFLAGFPLHYLWKAVGSKILLLSMILIWPFLWTAAMTYGFRRYQRDITAIHKKFAPPGSKYRTGKSGGPAQRY